MHSASMNLRKQKHQEAFKYLQRLLNITNERSILEIYLRLADHEQFNAPAECFGSI